MPGDVTIAASVIAGAATVITGMLRYGPSRNAHSNGFVTKAVCNAVHEGAKERQAGVETRLASLETKIDNGLRRIHDRLDERKPDRRE